MRSAPCDCRVCTEGGGGGGCNWGYHGFVLLGAQESTRRSHTYRRAKLARMTAVLASRHICRINYHYLHYCVSMPTVYLSLRWRGPAGPVVVAYICNWLWRVPRCHVHGSASCCGGQCALKSCLLGRSCRAHTGAPCRLCRAPQQQARAHDSTMTACTFHVPGHTRQARACTHSSGAMQSNLVPPLSHTASITLGQGTRWGVRMGAAVGG